MDEKKLDALTPKQRTAVQLKEKGLTIKQVAAAMGVTYNAAREHLRHAERRFREYEEYMAVEKRNLEPADLQLTRGEVKLIMEALRSLEREYEKSVVKNVKSDCRGKLPYESNVIADLYDRMQEVIYGRSIIKMLPDWEGRDKKRVSM